MEPICKFAIDPAIFYSSPELVEQRFVQGSRI